MKPVSWMPSERLNRLANWPLPREIVSPRHICAMPPANNWSAATLCTAMPAHAVMAAGPNTSSPIPARAVASATGAIRGASSRENTGLPSSGYSQASAYATELTAIAGPTNTLPAWFGPLVPGDLWACNTMRGANDPNRAAKTVITLGQRVI